MALGNLLRRTLAPASLCALALAACGSQQAPEATTTNPAKPLKHDDQTVWIYSSLPKAGPERTVAAQIRQGIRLALNPVENTTYHGFHVRYAALNDSRMLRRRRGASSSPSTRDRAGTTTTVTNSDGWNPTATVDNAEQAARNAQTIAYIGDLDSGATALSLPILNQAGILQITPGSGYPGLTDAYKGVTQPTTEPGKYYPHAQQRTLLRLIPSDIVQAAATVDVLAGTGCRQLGVWTFPATKEPAEVGALARAVALTAPEYKMTVYNVHALPPIKQISTYAAALHNDIRCAVFVGHATPAAVELATELRLQIGATIVGTSGFCNPSWVRGIAKLVSKAEARTVAEGLSCTTPELPVTSRQYIGHKAFIAKFRAAYDRQPTAYAYYGYEAAAMVLRALSGIGRGEDNRRQVLRALVDDFVGDATYPFNFDGSGNTDSEAYGVDIFVNGIPTPHRTVTPFPLLSSGG